jgi:diguanylate cyclase (GGDEF)-like protein/PAS domain S-box-containing protein
MTFNYFHWVKPVSPARGMGIAWFVLFGSLFITVWVWHLTGADNERLARERFEHQVIQIQSEISDRLLSYEQVLRGFVSFLNGSEEVTRQEWRRYYDNLEIEQNYPGIQGIGFVRHILPADKDALIQQICAEGFPDFTIWPAGERSEYTSIVYIEPFDWRNRQAFGYDMFSEPVRRAAMEQARDTGGTAVSGKITPVQETDQNVQAEFLVYLPVYQRNRPLETVEQRRAALLGYVYGSLRMNDLMRGIPGRITPADIHLEIFDGKEISERTRLYDSDLLIPVQESRHFTLRTELDVGGHRWTLLVSAKPGFTAVYQGLSPLMVLLVGVLASLLLFLITWSLATTRQRTLALANRMTTAIKESETRLREITATLEEGVYVQDSEGRITFVNPEAQKLLGWSLEELIGQEAHSLFHAHTGNTTFPGGVCPLLQSARAGASFRSEDDAFRRRDGTTLAVAVVASPIWRQGQHAGAVVAFRDITERKQAEAVRRDNQRFRALFEYSREALFLLDISGRIVDVNRLACESLGYMRATLLHVSFPVVVGNLRIAGVAVSLAQIIERVRQHESVVVEAEFSRQDGRSTPVESLFSLIDHEGRHLVLAAVRDITERKQAEIGWKQALTELEQAKLEMERINQRLLEANRELQRISQQDGLTGIANRRYFDEYLVREWRRASRSAQTLALILADVDHFKAYNDCYGHQAGDDCLHRITEVLSAEVRRPADLLARYGGEEVVAALPDTSLEGALQIAENMRIAVEVLAIPHARSATAPHVTLSLGVAAVVPRPDILPRWLIGTADKALYQAKAEGRNRVCVGERYKGG